jgi:hypothetical protein
MDFSKKNILIPNVAEQNLLILEEEGHDGPSKSDITSSDSSNDVCRDSIINNNANDVTNDVYIFKLPGGMDFSKKNILIPNVAEQNLLILEEEKQI